MCHYHKIVQINYVYIWFLTTALTLVIRMLKNCWPHAPISKAHMIISHYLYTVEELCIVHWLEIKHSVQTILNKQHYHIHTHAKNSKKCCMFRKHKKEGTCRHTFTYTSLLYSKILIILLIHTESAECKPINQYKLLIF